MNEILQKRIEETAKKYAAKIEEQNPNSEAYNIDGIFIAGATFALENQWISVKETLPELPSELPSSAVSEIVLIKCVNGAITRARYVKILGDFTTYVWQCVDAGFNVGKDKVTHWMPIPKLKKGGEK